MNPNLVSQNVGAYIAWKQNIIRQLARYRSWLQSSHMDTGEIDEKLEQVQGSLQRDNITIAFVGEFSRGKTELINALFFTQYGQRLLPSRAGRTTMCPAELFFDIENRESYVQLLPIKTRKNGTSIRKFKQEPRLWVTLPLNISDTEQMSQTLGEVARCKSVSRADAEELGFSTTYLEKDAKHPGNVLIPAWRHALISFDHPLLRQGLTIIDTPGLNALGSEPELTFSLLPEAHAMLFMLSADTGVTQTDMEIWTNHVRPYCNHLSNNFFAVLNKVDMLWEDPEEDFDAQKQIDHICSLATQQLELPVNGILPISAKQALIGKIRAEDERIARSNIASIEQLLSDHIVAKKEEALQSTVVNYVVQMTRNSMRALQDQIKNMKQQELMLKKDLKNNHDHFLDISEKTQAEEKAHHQTLLLIRSSQRMLQKKANSVLAPIKPHQFEIYLAKTQETVKASWTTMGISKAMTDFFKQVNNDFSALAINIETANQMVHDIYDQYNAQNHCTISNEAFSVEIYTTAISRIRERSEQYHQSFLSVLKGHRSSAESFFDALARETQALYERAHQDAKEWCQTALLPILQSAQERKKLISEQLLQLRAMIQENSGSKVKIQQLSERIQQLDRQLESLKQISIELQRPAPSVDHKTWSGDQGQNTLSA